MNDYSLFMPKSTVLNVGDNGINGLGNEIKIAFLGSSVTYGYLPGADNDICGNTYCKHCAEYLKKLFPYTNVTWKNFGISGTACLIGMSVAANKLSEFKPNIVIVEYAINEERSCYGLARFEGLVRNLLSLKSAPVVIPLAVFDKNGYSCEDFMLETAKNYGLYFCGLRTTVFNLFAENKIKWEKYSPDNGHPTEWGHRLIAECLCEVLALAAKKDYSPKKLAKPIFGGECFDGFTALKENQMNITGFYPLNTDFYSFNRNMAGKGSECALQAKIVCRTLTVVFIQSQDENFGSADIYIDGKIKNTLCGNSILGWNNPVAVSLFVYSDSAEHSLEIHTDGKKFILSGIYFSP